MTNVIKLFHPHPGELIKIYHIFTNEWKTIGEVEEINSNFNTVKVKFITLNNKRKSYWFNLASGNIVRLPKKKNSEIEMIENREEGGYKLSNEMIYPYEHAMYFKEDIESQVYNNNNNNVEMEDPDEKQSSVSSIK